MIKLLPDYSNILQLVADHYTAGEIVELMNYTSEELLELIGPDVVDNINVFEAVLEDLGINVEEDEELYEKFKEESEEEDYL